MLFPCSASTLRKAVQLSRASPVCQHQEKLLQAGSARLNSYPLVLPFSFQYLSGLAQLKRKKKSFGFVWVASVLGYATRENRKQQVKACVYMHIRMSPVALWNIQDSEQIKEQKEAENLVSVSYSGSWQMPKGQVWPELPQLRVSEAGRRCHKWAQSCLFLQRWPDGGNCPH